jgi:hypothetical protein
VRGGMLVRSHYDRVVGWRRAAGVAAVAGLVLAAAPSPGQSQTPPAAERRVAVSTAPWPIAAARSGRRGPDVQPRLQARECRLGGWTFFVVSGGECMNLSDARGLARDPDAWPGEFDAGFGWRGASAAVILGYADAYDGWVQEEHNPTAANLAHGDEHGLFGVSAVLRWR